MGDLWTSKDAHTLAMARPEMRPFVAQAMPLLEGVPKQIEIELAGGKGPFLTETNPEYRQQ